jgi:hypothetical protein
MPLWRVIFRLVLSECISRVDVRNLFGTTKTQVAVFLEHGNTSLDSIQGTEFYDRKKTVRFLPKKSVLCVELSKLCTEAACSRFDPGNRLP